MELCTLRRETHRQKSTSTMSAGNVDNPWALI